MLIPFHFIKYLGYKEFHKGLGDCPDSVDIKENLNGASSEPIVLS